MSKGFREQKLSFITDFFCYLGFSGVYDHQKCTGLPPGRLDPVWQIGSVARRIARFEAGRCLTAGDCHIPLDDGEMFARTTCVRVASEAAVGGETDLIDLVFARLFRRRQDADTAPGAEIIDGRHILTAEDLDLIGAGRVVEETREIDLESTCQIPERRNGRAAFAAFDLADHGARHARKPRHGIEGQPLCTPCIFQAHRKLGQDVVVTFRHDGCFADMRVPVNLDTEDDGRSLLTRQHGFRIMLGNSNLETDMTQEIVILDGARTAIGTFGGSLAGTPPIELATVACKAALERSGIEGGQIGHVVFGHVINTEPRDMYLSRVAALQAGVPDIVPAMNVNRLCGSGAQAIVSVIQSLMLGDAAFGLAGGAENMSRSPFIVPDQRWGAKMGDIKTLDMMLGALNCPFGTGHMGVTAENVAAEHGISRADQDAFALQSQERAAAAIAAGHFESQIVPVEVRVKRDTVAFKTDEHPKATTAEALAGLRPVFQKDGSVTAGNASGINDGAAALVLATADAARKAGLKPKARVLGYAHAGVRPQVMGIGPVPAVRNLLERTGLAAGNFDVIESNEAFAAQALAVSKELGFDPAKVNPNGGAIALGHPVGATGAILTLKALYELERTGGKRALITMCIGGGQGIALAFERL